jgi:nicotinamide-nucleotide amidase
MSPLAEAIGLPVATLEGVLAALKARGETVAAAESLTAGLVCASTRPT